MAYNREHRKLIHVFDAITLDRPGYWGCINCGAHNHTTFDKCSICGADCWITHMPTQLISLGPVTSLLQNVVYALPASRCLLFCDTAAATFEQSTTAAFTLAVALTLDANEQIEVAGGFIRCTSGNVNVTLKKA